VRSNLGAKLHPKLLSIESLFDKGSDKVFGKGNDRRDARQGGGVFDGALRRAIPESNSGANWNGRWFVVPIDRRYWPHDKVVWHQGASLTKLSARKENTVMNDWNESDWFKTWLKLARKGRQKEG
jgi:hypothetical protein